MNFDDVLREEFEELMVVYAADAATDEQFARMQQLLDASEDARACYVDYLDMHTKLYWHHRRSDVESKECCNAVDKKTENAGTCRHSASDGFPAHNETSVLSQPSFPSLNGDFQSSFVSSYSGWLMAYFVAAVVVAVGLSIAALVHMPSATQLVQQSDSSSARLATDPVANESIGRITGIVDCVFENSSQWSVGSGQKNLKSEIRHLKSPVSLGDRFALRSGLLEITYDTGAKVILQGPVKYEVGSAASGYLAVGRLTARLEKHDELQKGMPDVPHSFAVRTPTAIVTDLGTEFGVDVSETGVTRTQVFSGVVEVQQSNHGSGPAEKRRMVAGDSATIGPKEVVVTKVVSALNNAVEFVRQLPRQSRNQNTTLAYWRFENGQANASLLAGRDVVRDQSGHGNHLWLGNDAVPPRYVADMPFRTIPQTGDANALALAFKTDHERPTGLCTYATINNRAFSAWTVEAAVCLDRVDLWQCFVGKDGKPLDKIGDAPLQMKLNIVNPKEPHFQISCVDAAHTARSLIGKLPVAAKKWYHLAATNDGKTLKLYVKRAEESEYALDGSMRSDGALDSMPGCWSVGRGFFGGEIIDWTYGRIDEVRISAVALEPNQFLFHRQPTKIE